MRVLFVFPDLFPNITNYTGSLSFGIALLSAILKQGGHETRLYHVYSRPSEGEFSARVRESGADLVAFTATSHYARRLLRWAALARAAARAPVIVGGIHATMAPEEVSSIPDVDFTCVGEGELALLELCDALATGRDPSRIANLWARRDGAVVRNPQRPRWQDLDRLPDPDFSLFDFPRLHLTRRGIFPYLMARGCGFHCTYCSVPGLRRASPGPGPYWRFMSPARAAHQLRDLLARYMPAAQRVYIGNAILFPHADWLAEFAPLYKEMIGKPFTCNLRADFVTPETAALLQDMGCVVARLGVESGDEAITSGLLGRQLVADQVGRAFALLAEHGVERWSYNMFGLPGETLPQALKTARFNGELRPERMHNFIFYPYPGTRLRELCAERGYLTDVEYDHATQGVVVRQPSIRDADVLFMHRFFVPLVRLYSAAHAWSPRWRRAWGDALDAVLASPLLPRGSLVGLEEAYRNGRHRLGEFLVRRSPRLYHLLGGTDPL